jgi:hypothetical protein
VEAFEDEYRARQYAGYYAEARVTSCEVMGCSAAGQFIIDSADDGQGEFAEDEDAVPEAGGAEPHCNHDEEACDEVYVTVCECGALLDPYSGQWVGEE